MDTTSPSLAAPRASSPEPPPIEEPEALLLELATADPAAAPVVADRLAAELERRQDASS